MSAHAQMRIVQPLRAFAIGVFAATDNLIMLAGASFQVGAQAKTADEEVQRKSTELQETCGGADLDPDHDL